MSAKTAGYAATPHRLGPNNLWNKPGFKLPNYIENVVKGLMESGKSRQDAIPIAIGTVRRWAAGGGNVHPEVVAASKAAIAQWEALKARAKSVKSTRLTAGNPRRLTLSWDPSQHPRVASGTGGGQFTTAQQSAGGKPRDAQAAQAQQNTAAKAQFDQLKAMTPAQRAAFLASLTPAQRAALTAFAYSAKTSDPKIVAARIALANANAKAGKTSTASKAAGAAKKSGAKSTAGKGGAGAGSAAAKKPAAKKPAAHKATAKKAPAKKATATKKPTGTTKPTTTKPATKTATRNPPATQKGTPAKTTVKASASSRTRFNLTATERQLLFDAAASVTR